MKRRTDIYADFVEHPRYGQRPRYTGLNPVDGLARRVYLGWHSRADERISETAIAANRDRQPNATVPVTHYFDLKRSCRDCGRNFIFFADEQRHWYETLHFYLGADCVRCIDCRVAQRNTIRLRQRYEMLLNQPERSDREMLELAETAMILIDRDVFGHRCIERVRSILNSIPAESKVRRHTSFCDIDLCSKAPVRNGE